MCCQCSAKNVVYTTSPTYFISFQMIMGDKQAEVLHLGYHRLSVAVTQLTV